MKETGKSIFINAKFLTEPPTGIGRFSIELSKELRKKYPEIVFIAPPAAKKNPLCEVLNVSIVGLGKGALWEQLFLPFYLYWKGTPLLINFTSTAPVLYNNQIVTIHDLTAVKHPEWYSRLTHYYYKILFPLISKNNVALLTVSNYVKHDLMRYYKIPETKIKVVYNAISAIFKPNPKDFGFKFLLCVGSIDPRKNLKRIIEAFLLLNQSDLHLVLIGHRHKAFQQQEFSIPEQFSEKIHFTGYISDEELVYYYSSAEAFLYLSLEEGFGIPPLEAMACNSIVLVSKTSSLPEVCGEAVYYANPWDVDDIRKSILHILTASEEELAFKKSLYKKHLLHFSWHQSAETISELIKKIT